MICFLDFETTGIDVFKDFPIEIGAILVDEKLDVINEFHSYINPNRKRRIKKSALKIHGLDEKFLRDKPLPNEVIEGFFKTFGTDFKLAGWNISFDVTLLRKLSHQNNFMRQYNQLNYRHLDIQSISYLHRKIKKLDPNQNSLNDACKYFGLQRDKTHNALDDALLTLKVYKSILGELKINF